MRKTLFMLIFLLAIGILTFAQDVGPVIENQHAGLEPFTSVIDNALFDAQDEPTIIIFNGRIIEVPYESGMDWYSGILEAAEALGVVTRNGAWYTFGDTKFQRKTLDEHKEAIFNEVKARDEVLEYEIPKEDLESSE